MVMVLVLPAAELRTANLGSGFPPAHRRHKKWTSVMRNV
jgi:hypothetical protein